MPPISAPSHRRARRGPSSCARRLPDGRTCWVQWADTAIFDGEGHLVEIQAVGRDVTDQRNSELALRASEASYRALVETQTEFVLRQQPDGRLTFVNEAYCRYVGKPREQLLDASWNDLLMIAAEDRAAYIRHLRALTPTQPTAAAELRAILPNGAERWEQWVDTGIFDDDGLLIEVQSVGRDITERKRSELALRESEARYRALVETQTEFVLRQLPEGRLTFVNEAYCRYVGKPRDFLLSEAFNGLDMMVPEDLPRFEAHLRRLTPRTADGDHGDARDPARWVAALGALGRHGHLRRQRAALGASVDRPRHHRPEERRAGSAGERGALSGGGRGSDRVHSAPRPRRQPDVRQRRVLPLSRHRLGRPSSAVSTTSRTIRPSSRSASARLGPA